MRAVLVLLVLLLPAGRRSPPRAARCALTARSDVRSRASDLATDRLEGGDGLDRLVFAGRRAAVVARIGGAEQSAGSAGERNLVSGFEAIEGGRGADTITVERLVATRSMLSPLLAGGSGADRLTLTGTAAAPLIGVEGGSGSDTIVGGEGRDVLHGDAGRDTLTGAGGNDVLVGGTGADRLDCGPGRDRAARDRRDRIRRCERR